MRFSLFVFSIAIILVHCSDNKSVATKAPFCDTTCSQDSFLFSGDHKFMPSVSIAVKNCAADTLTWVHGALDAGRQMHLGTLLESPVRLNKSAIDCYIRDTSYAWLSFNDCATGRGYLLKLPFNKAESVSKMSSAINAFDKKFVLPNDLRAYADYTTIYVIDVATNKMERMTFKEEYDIDWNDIHQTIDSVNISRSRIFVQLMKAGQPVQLEKAISL